jgi:hypothetical protein
MLKKTLKIVSSLLLSLLIGIVVTLLVDSTEDAAVEKKIRKTVEDNINNAVVSFKASALHPTPRDEKNFIIKFVDTVMADKAVVHEHASDRLPETEDKDLAFLFTLSGTGYSLDVYLQQKFIKSELALLDMPDYISGIVATIIVFAFTVYFTENKKRTLLMKQQLMGPARTAEDENIAATGRREQRPAEQGAAGHAHDRPCHGLTARHHAADHRQHLIRRFRPAPGFD